MPQEAERGGEEGGGAGRGWTWAKCRCGRHLKINLEPNRRQLAQVRKMNHSNAREKGSGARET